MYRKRGCLVPVTPHPSTPGLVGQDVGGRTRSATHAYLLQNSIAGVEIFTDVQWPLTLARRANLYPPASFHQGDENFQHRFPVPFVLLAEIVILPPEDTPILLWYLWNFRFLSFALFENRKRIFPSLWETFHVTRTLLFLKYAVAHLGSWNPRNTTNISSFL